jgi:hypothetical protein
LTETVATDTVVEPREHPDQPPASPPGHPSLRRLALWILVCAGVFVVVTMGSSLIGRTTQTISEQLNAFEPWRSEQPQDFSYPGSWYGDHINAFLPAIDEFVGRLHDGNLAWWSPLNNGGLPLASIGEPFSPLLLPYLVLPLWLAPVYSHLIVIGVSIAGMTMFLRRLGLSAAAGVLAGFAFATSGFMYMWLHWPQVRVGAMVPWLFWAVERALQERRWATAIPVAVVTAILYAGFFPALAVQVLAAAGIYVVVRLLMARRDTDARRQMATTAAVTLGGVALGLGLVAWLILPFATWVSDLDLGYREQTTACHAPPRSVVSVVFPRYGSAEQFEFICPQGEHETDGFAGAMVLGLAVLGAITAKRFRPGLPRGALGYFVVLALTVGMLVYFGGPGLWLIQQLPVFGDNRITRVRVLLAFAIAVLAGVGLERLIQLVRRREPNRLLVVVAGLMVLLALVCLMIRDWIDIPMPALGGWVPFGACLAAAATMAAAGTRRIALRQLAVIAVPVIVTVEAVAAIGPYWPAEDPDALYAATSTTDFLQANIGSDRYVSASVVLLANSNRAFDLRTLTGRGFYEDEWGELITTISGRQLGNRTTSFVPLLPADRVVTPVLDRLAVRYYVTHPIQPVYGVVEPMPGESGPFELAPGEPAVVEVTGPVRAVGLELAQDPDVGGERPRVRVELVDASGTVLATGSSRVYPSAAAGPWHVAVPGDLAEDAVAARVTLVDADRPLELTGAGGGPAAFVMRPAPDGLRLVHSEGTVIYERLGAVPRLRWASESMVEADPERRLDVLDDPSVPASTVVLSEPGRAASGRPADLEVLEDSGNRIRIRVEAEGDGYLVVADAIQRGWAAEVDGEAADLRDADHAVAAVAVPEGEHEVVVEYRPPGQRVGWAIAGASVLILAGIGGVSYRRRGPMGGSSGSGARPRRPDHSQTARSA